MGNKSFSYRKALDNDFNLTLAILVPCFFWGLYLLALIFNWGSPIFFYICVVITAASPFIMVWRLRSIRALFDSGEAITGKITRVFFERDRGVVQYIYPHAGQDYKGTAIVFKNKSTLEFKDGQPIDLFIDPQRPEKSYVLDLYTKK